MYRWKLEGSVYPYLDWEELGTFPYFWMAELAEWWVKIFMPFAITRIWRTPKCSKVST